MGGLSSIGNSTPAANLATNQPAPTTIDQQASLQGRSLKLLESGSNTFSNSVYRRGLHTQSSELKALQKEIKLLQKHQGPEQLKKVEDALSLWKESHPKEYSKRSKHVPELQKELSSLKQQHTAEASQRQAAAKEQQQLNDPRYQDFELRKKVELREALAQLPRDRRSYQQQHSPEYRRHARQLITDRKKELKHITKQQKQTKVTAEVIKDVLENHLGLKFKSLPRFNADIRAAIHHTFSEQTVNYVLNKCPELKEDGPVQFEKITSSVSALDSLVNPGVAIAQKHNAAQITPFQQSRFIGERAFGQEGICAALSAKWMASQQVKENFYQDIGFIDGFSASKLTDGQEEVMNLAIQYYSDSNRTNTTGERWNTTGKNREDKLIEYFKENYGLELDVSQSGIDNDKLNISQVNQPGLYYFAIHGNGQDSGHALAAKVELVDSGRDWGQKVFTLFDPNYGEAQFKDINQFQNYVHNLVNERYPELTDSSYVLCFN
ncbi:YopT-type cysteine protease domain-containing protein [Spartinivicinus poritis]|uniref:YopT-type cysteine protease domain-containing protein n=1 Tax=Spartinivicinus poritis TaxID=2994640 RepID=A0ABT5UBN9_9GAMM|nr:YopT-type cysteine protease domain-containing protein [Spartinivicinus sp. A2-2]MDE1463796.1 YopT-type cysteine protease domain-containing protein [Spartinivicinus sp. A2-2]